MTDIIVQSYHETDDISTSYYEICILILSSHDLLIIMLSHSMAWRPLVGSSARNASGALLRSQEQQRCETEMAVLRNKMQAVLKFGRGDDDDEIQLDIRKPWEAKM